MRGKIRQKKKKKEKKNQFVQFPNFYAISQHFFQRKKIRPNGRVKLYEKIFIRQNIITINFFYFIYTLKMIIITKDIKHKILLFQPSK